MKSIFAGAVLSTIVITLLIVLIWAPFGMGMMGMIEDWGISAVTVTSGHPPWFISADSRYAGMRMRPLAFAPFALAYELGNGRFLIWHLLLSFVLLIKCGAMYGILFWTTRSAKLSLFGAVLFLVFPADTAQMTTRILPLNFSVAFTFLGIALFIWCTDLPGRFHAWTLSLLGALVFVTGVLIYEGGVLLALLPLLLLWVRSGFRQGIQDLKRSLVPAGVWVVAILALTANVARVVTDPNSYQMLLSGGSAGVLTKIFSNSDAMVTVAYYRVFIHSWRDSFFMLLGNIQHVWPYVILCIGMLCAAIALVSHRGMNWSMGARLFVVGLLTTALGFAPYLVSASHILITQRTYLFAAAGGVLCFVVVFSAASSILRFSGGVLFVLLAILGMGSQWEQVRHYSDLSNRQREILSGILEAAPGAEKILIRDRSGSLDNIWMLRGGLLSGALTVLQGRQIATETCLSGTMLWASFYRGPLGEPGKCDISDSLWTLKAGKDTTFEYKTAEASVIDISPDRKITLVNGNPGALPAARERWASILGCVGAECAYQSTKNEEFEYDFGTYWSLDSAPFGEGWGDAGWKVPALAPLSYAWTNAEKSRLQFDLKPRQNLYALTVKLVPLFDLQEYDGASVRVNEHEASMKLTDNTLTTDVPHEWLVDGNNVIELSFKVHPEWGVGVPVDDVALRPKQ